MEGGKVFTKRGKLKKEKKPKKSKKKGVGPQTFIKTQEIEIPKNEVIEIPKPRGRPKSVATAPIFTIPRPPMDRTLAERNGELYKLLTPSYQENYDEFVVNSFPQKRKIINKVAGHKYSVFPPKSGTTARNEDELNHLYLLRLAEVERDKKEKAGEKKPLASEIAKSKKGEETELFRFRDGSKEVLTSSLGKVPEDKLFDMTVQPVRMFPKNPFEAERKKSAVRDIDIIKAAQKAHKDAVTAAAERKKQARLERQEDALARYEATQKAKETKAAAALARKQAQGEAALARKQAKAVKSAADTEAKARAVRAKKQEKVITYPQIDKPTQPAKKPRGRPKKEPEPVKYVLAGKKRQSAKSRMEQLQPLLNPPLSALTIPEETTLPKKSPRVSPVDNPQAPSPKRSPKMTTPPSAEVPPKKRPPLPKGARPYKSTVTPTEAKAEAVMERIEENAPASLKPDLKEFNKLREQDEKEHDDETARYAALAAATRGKDPADLERSFSKSSQRPPRGTDPSLERLREKSKSRIREEFLPITQDEREVGLVLRDIVLELEKRSENETKKEEEAKAEALAYVKLIEASIKEEERQKKITKATQKRLGSLMVKAKLKNEAERFKKAADEYNAAITAQKLVRGKLAKTELANLKQQKKVEKEVAKAEIEAQRDEATEKAKESIEKKKTRGRPKKEVAKSKSTPEEIKENKERRAEVGSVLNDLLKSVEAKAEPVKYVSTSKKTRQPAKSRMAELKPVIEAKQEEGRQIRLAEKLAADKAKDEAEAKAKAERAELKRRGEKVKADRIAKAKAEALERLKRENASTKLQAYARSYLSTHEFKTKKEATTKIQSFFRMNAAMKDLSLKKQDKLLEDMIKAAKEEELQEKLQDKVKYEKKLAIEAELLKLDAIEDAINELETEQQSATTLQSATRKRQAKKQLDALKKDRDELKAATKLQSVVRAYKPKKELAAYKTEKELERLAREQEEEQAQQELIKRAREDYDKARLKAERYNDLLAEAEAKDKAERVSSEGAEKGGKKEVTPRKARPQAERKAEREKAAKLEQEMEEAAAKLKVMEDAEEKRQQRLKELLEKEKKDEAEKAETKAKKKAEKEAKAKARDEARKAKAEAKGKKPKKSYMESSSSDEDLPLGALMKKATGPTKKEFEEEQEKKRNQRLQEELEAERKRNEENAAKLKKQLDKINGASGQVIVEELKEELEALGITTANQLAEIPRKLRYKIIGLSAKDKAVKLDVLDLDELERADAELAEYRKKSAKEKRELIAKDRAEAKAKKAAKEEGSKLLKVKTPAAAAEPEEDVYDYDISAPTFQRVFSKVQKTEKAAEKADKEAAKAQAAAEKRATKEAEKKAKEEAKAKATAEKAAAREARKAEARKGGTAEKAKPLAALKVPEEVAVAASQSPKSPQTPKYAFTGMYGITQLLGIDAKDLSENPELKAELVNTDKVFKERKAKAIAEGKTFDPELNEYAVSQLEKIRGLVELDKQERAQLAGILAQARANNKKSAAKKPPPEKVSLNKGVSHFEALEKEAKQAAAEAADEPVGSGLPYGRAKGMGDLSDGDVESEDGGGSDQEEKLSHDTYIMPSPPILRRGFKHPAMASPGMSDHLHPNAAANIHAFSGGLLGRGRSRSRSPSPDDMSGMGMSGCGGAIKDKMEKAYHKAVPKSLRPAVEDLAGDTAKYAVRSKAVKEFRQDAKKKYEKTVPKSLRPAVAELAKDTGEFAKRQSGFGLKKGSEAARKFMAELRARRGKKMKGGAIPEPPSRSPITDASLL
jgi:hypothetical protein